MWQPDPICPHCGTDGGPWTLDGLCECIEDMRKEGKSTLIFCPCTENTKHEPFRDSSDGQLRCNLCGMGPLDDEQDDDQEDDDDEETALVPATSETWPKGIDTL